MKYSQYTYKRINLEKFKKDVEVMIKDFKSAKSVDNQIKIIQEYQKIQKETQTFANIANLVNSLDTAAITGINDHNST